MLHYTDKVDKRQTRDSLTPMTLSVEQYKEAENSAKVLRILKYLFKSLQPQPNIVRTSTSLSTSSFYLLQLTEPNLTGQKSKKRKMQKFVKVGVLLATLQGIQALPYGHPVGRPPTRPDSIIANGAISCCDGGNGANPIRSSMTTDSVGTNYRGGDMSADGADGGSVSTFARTEENDEAIKGLKDWHL